MRKVRVDTRVTPEMCKWVWANTQGLGSLKVIHRILGFGNPQGIPTVLIVVVSCLLTSWTIQVRIENVRSPQYSESRPPFSP